MVSGRLTLRRVCPAAGDGHSAPLGVGAGRHLAAGVVAAAARLLHGACRRGGGHIAEGAPIFSREDFMRGAGSYANVVQDATPSPIQFASFIVTMRLGCFHGRSVYFIGHVT